MRRRRPREDIRVTWTIDRYPASMTKLPPVARAKAIVIANALLEHGCAEEQAIRIAIARAQAWVVHMRIGDLEELGV